MEIHEYSQCYKWFIPYRITMGKDVKYPKEIIFYDEIKILMKKKLFHYFQFSLKVHVFIITMRQGEESEKFL